MGDHDNTTELYATRAFVPEEEACPVCSSKISDYVSKYYFMKHVSDSAIVALRLRAKSPLTAWVSPNKTVTPSATRPAQTKTGVQKLTRGMTNGWRTQSSKTGCSPKEAACTAPLASMERKLQRSPKVNQSVTPGIANRCSNTWAGLNTSKLWRHSNMM